VKVASAVSSGEGTRYPLLLKLRNPRNIPAEGNISDPLGVPENASEAFDFARLGPLLAKLTGFLPKVP
jgi:hypothetical protein